MQYEHALTCHAAIRMRQRGLRDDDIRLLLTTASEVSSDAYLLTDQDVMREISKRKREIQTLERLRGCKLVVNDGAILTCYRPGPKNLKKTLRGGGVVA